MGNVWPTQHKSEVKFESEPDDIIKLNRWKPLIIADVLRTSKALLWVDSSTLFVEDTLSLQDILEREANDRQGVWFFDATGHSIAAATNPLMFKFLPITAEQATGVEMWGANTVLWIGREDIRANVLRPFVECALIKDCMAPVGSQLFCRFSEPERKLYANCHRFDQSALNVIVSSRAGFNITKYTMSKTVIKTYRMA
uniref:Nucleotide-diphospho-sugar transferase domain-containing protein n=1 Tax=Ascaris lumbricoides TaxID=6252 RepID=A0A9J2PNX1_ASCLU